MTRRHLLDARLQEDEGIVADLEEDNEDGIQESQGSNTARDLMGTPGLELLSPSERRLCSEIHLLPAHYMAVKVRTTDRSIDRPIDRPTDR